MIRRIELSEEDRKRVLSQEAPQAEQDMSFVGNVVNKPWGYEYLMFKNHDIEIWFLYLKKGFSTSLHCHPQKKTGLLLLTGEARCTTFTGTHTLREKDGLIFEKGVFHKTEALSENGIFLIEVETPPKKSDIFRLADDYHREKKGYTDKKNVTNKIYNYHYLYIKDEKNAVNVFGKYKFLLKEYSDTASFLEGGHQEDIGLLLSGEVQDQQKTFTTGDILHLGELHHMNISSPARILFLRERKNLIRLADFVISYLLKQGIDQVFTVSGGNIAFLLEAIRVRPAMKYVCTHHEQAAAMAAEGYARVRGKPGFLLVTTGPGGTNTITGVAGAWTDSTPLLVISGQAYHDQTVGDSGLRQLGVQELNITEIVKPITKYVVMVRDPMKIKYHLQKALHLATTGRPGPVWLDIPINLQNAMIEEDELESFQLPQIHHDPINENLTKEVLQVLNILREAKRPVLLMGNGVRLAKAQELFLAMAEKLSIPILTSRNANDLIWEDHPLYAGRPGSFSHRSANFAIQNADVVLSIGSRISLGLTGWAYRDFVREGKLIVVDIDATELEKSTIRPSLAIHADLKDFICEMLLHLESYAPQDLSEWKAKIKYWKEKYPVVLPEYKEVKDAVNTYYFLDLLSDELGSEDIVVTDMGMAFQCTMQALRLKRGQQLFTNGGMAPMGYGLPAAIGACFANNKRRIVCIVGDGGLQFNIQELQTVVHYKLPIKIFVFNNNGYSAIRETQNTYFTGFIASEPSSGVSFPDTLKIARAYGIASRRVSNHTNLSNYIREALDGNDAFICDLIVSEQQRVSPKQGAFNRPDGKTVPRPIEDMLPYLDRAELEKDMIIEAIPFDPYKDEA